jgi:thiol-disulfide isomerase/thioredoxin
MATALVGTVAVLFAINAAPSVSAMPVADPGKPFVVKLHARWCPYCLMQKDEWSAIETAYTGRVNFVVLDFTNERTTERSRSEAERLNLVPFFDEYAGVTGVVVVVDGRTKDVLAEVGGNQTFEEYRAAIDAALAGR